MPVTFRRHMSTCADDLSHAPAQAAGSEWRPLAYMSYEELAAGAFVETRPTAPISYRVDVGKWGELLAIGPNDPPAWRPWAAMHAFVAALMEWSQRLPAESDLVLASEARDIMSEYGVMLVGSGATAPNGPVSRRGASRAVHGRAEGMCGVLGGNGVATEKDRAP